MACPHSLIGSPELCSQCLGVTPLICKRDEQTGVITVDGKPVERAFQPAGSMRNGPPPRKTGRPKKEVTRAVADLRARERSLLEDAPEPVDEIDDL